MCHLYGRPAAWYHLDREEIRTGTETYRKAEMRTYMETRRNLQIAQDRLLPGTEMEGSVLTLPPEGGGIELPEIAGTFPRYLNAHMHVLSDHAQAFELRAYAKDETEARVVIRFGLMPDFHAAVALDLTWLDGHILFPGHRVGMQKIVCHGSRIEPDEIHRTILVSMPSTGPVRVEMGDLYLSDEPCPVITPSRIPQIDTFGQYTQKDWPWKIRSEEKLREMLLREAEKEAAYPFPFFNRWGGDTRMHLKDGTGYFSTCKKDGRWYLADPDGCAFFSLGPDCVVARCDARIDGLENLLEDLPGRDEESADLYEDMKRSFGETPRGPGILFSYERRNLRRAFGKDWYSRWQDLVIGQLMRLGMNTLGNWSDASLFGRMPYVTSLPSFPDTEAHIFRDFPDVLSEEYVRSAHACASALKSRADDPYMIGYFLRNEPAWAFVDNLILAEEVLRNPVRSFCRTALTDFLRSRHGTVRNLSSAWRHDFTSFDDLLNPLDHAASLSPEAARDLRDFSALLIDRYIRVPAEACRQADRHHLNLGMRWAWISDPLLVRGWDCIDVFSINCYAVDPTSALNQVTDLKVDLPVVIGEFHFGAGDAGLPATGLEAVADQEDRARAFRYYAEHAASHLQCVGCHWFQCYDQFALGRFDGENYNIGLFDITLQPYPALAKAVTETAMRANRIHAGLLVPVSDRPVSLPMIAY